MANVRPVWKGQISFGLVNIPITLYSTEKRTEIKFRMLDSRNHARIVIHTRDHLAAPIPEGGALLPGLMRYPQKLRKPAEFELPAADPAGANADLACAKGRKR